MAALFGLVLAGGRSVRMGRDKGAIDWHGVAQREYAAGLLSQICDKVFISCRAEQQGELGGVYPLLVDSVEGNGPIVAILTAFAEQEDAAWLVLACDLPLVTAETLIYLNKNRDEQSLATTFKSPYDGLPEPLVTIWEPAAAPILKLHLADGYRCPRKALIRNEERVRVLLPPDPDDIINTNTPEDLDRVAGILAQRRGV